MSNAQSNRPRRSFATGSAPSTGQQHVAAGLTYDGEDVPVLIRLPDLSPQALLRESVSQVPPQIAPTPASQTSHPVELEKPPLNVKVAAASESDVTPTDKDSTGGSAAAVVNPSAPEAPAPATSPVAETKPTPVVAVDPATTDKAADVGADESQSNSTIQSNSTTKDSTPTTAEGSARKSRRRKRAGRQQGGQKNEPGQLASQQESQKKSPRRRPEATTTDARPERSILAFDKSRLLIGAGLVVVAGLTYFALSGGGEDPVDPAGTWSGGGQASTVSKTVDPITEPEMNLWPPKQNAEVIEEDSSLAHQHGAEAITAPAGVSTWPTESTQQAANSYQADTLPAADYSYNTPPMTAPTNGQGSTAPSQTVPSNEGPTSGWPDEMAAPEQPTSLKAPVSGWPDSAMTPTPTDNAPSGAPNGYYQSQAAGYTASPSTDGRYEEAPAVRTGRLETAGPYPGGSNATANPGSQLNGTIEIPRPRANNEYNGPNVY